MSRFRIDTLKVDHPCTCDPIGVKHSADCPYALAPTRTWTDMSDGPAGSKWRARASAQEAALEAHGWTGGLGVPAMRVVDVETGETVWQYGHESYEHQAGPNVLPPWHDLIDLAARSDDEEVHRSCLRDAMRLQLPPTPEGALF